MEEGKDTHREKDNEAETKRQRDRDHIKPLDLFYFILFYLMLWLKDNPISAEALSH